MKAVPPSILDKRTENRGFEGLTVSPEGKSLYVAVQSPPSDQADPCSAAAPRETAPCDRTHWTR
ncbi:esterase-like activity of phytase family protein [Actinomadura violacea]|uniref:Esterase-like activity of phytase family protein n=1 Tax=Actinomadura violacea TaxID=2819934 RepID=A0ABS3S4A3_9ACTN|nr:esterase-like activity of phytase family protein [Actinomadura violacea]